jgi:RNA polymerase sigma-70 factor (ECF subfamily)
LWKHDQLEEDSLTAVEESTLSESTIDIASEFELLVKSHQRKMVALAYHLLGNLEDARDQAQEAFVRLWQRKEKSLEERAIAALLTKITVNLCIDRLREIKRRRLFFLDDEKLAHSFASLDDPRREAESGELKAALAAATAKLKPRQKAIFVLRDVEGHSVRETAEIIGCSENNVLVNLHKARKNLRKWLLPYLKS